MKKAAFASGLLLACAVWAVPSPASAEPGGCTAAAAVDLFMAGSCRYTATGPGEYTAVTVNQWRIEVSRDNGASWEFLAGAAFPTRPAAGTLATGPGDLVAVSIMWPQACQPHPLPPGCTKLARAGVVTAGDV